LVAVWSRTKERRDTIAETYGCDAVEDLQQIAGNPQIDMVSIATPDFAHAEPAVMMLEAGKHVLIEKPMAMSSAECEKILAARDRSGAKFMVNFHNRWYPPIAHAKKQIDAGEIGQPVLCYARLSDQIVVPMEWLSWAGQSGPEWFLFPHLIDLVRWLTGQEVRRVHAAGRKGLLASKGVDCYDAVQAQLVLDDAVAALESSWILPRAWRSIIDFKIDMVGTAGKLSIEGDREGLELVTDTENTTPFILDPTTTELLPFEHFIECVQEDREPTCTGEEGLAVTKVLEAVARSLQDSVPVTL